MPPKATIILTLYNVNPRYVEQCIDSIMAQSYQDFTIIAVDDCCKKYNYSWLRNMPKVQYIRNRRNIGMSRSVNKAFGKVNTEYCIRLGSDDLFDPDLLLKEVTFLDSHPDYVGVCCELQQFGKYNKVIPRPEKWDINIVFAGGYRFFGYDGGMMFRSHVLKKFRLDESMRICEDFDFQLHLMTEGKIHSIHETLYKYRKHDEQITAKAKLPERLENIRRSIEKVKACLQERG